ncbi:MAG: hypothetical protein FJZ01_12935, partial [Candidatus Sericytochromatia bacterium]|nr:hypothetical protein [Candidatus Tanganyikabacteria bacterium]
MALTAVDGRAPGTALLAPGTTGMIAARGFGLDAAPLAGEPAAGGDERLAAA